MTMAGAGEFADVLACSGGFPGPTLAITALASSTTDTRRVRITGSQIAVFKLARVCRWTARANDSLRAYFAVAQFAKHSSILISGQRTQLPPATPSTGVIAC